MNMPGFTAETTLYKTGQLYRGYSGISELGGVSNVVAAQISCDGWCDLAAFACFAGITTSATWWGAIIGAGICGISYAICKARCPSSGEDGGSGGPPSCCPPGTQCRCGGECQEVNGRLRCVDGQCLGPNQKCP